MAYAGFLNVESNAAESFYQFCYVDKVVVSQAGAKQRPQPLSKFCCFLEKIRLLISPFDDLL